MQATQQDEGVVGVPQSRARGSKQNWAAAVLFGLGMLVGACSGGGHEASGYDSDEPGSVERPSPSAGTTSAESTKCGGDAVMACKIYLPKHGDVVTCVDGLKLCQGGRWSECLAPETVESLLGDAGAATE
jgi:hypothetical protein